MAMKTRLRRKAAKRGRGTRLRRAASSSALTARAEAKGLLERDGGVLIGGAQDPAEKAADRIAAQALAGGPVSAGPPAAGGVAHRMCADCEQQEKAKRSAAPAAVMAPGARSAVAGPSATTAIRSMGAGQPLAKAARAFFEPRFGRDFSSVRLHDGDGADRAARSIDARAFVYGEDIAFARGERERGGMGLLAHELAHVAQDQGAARRTVRRAKLAKSALPADATYQPVPQKHKPRVNAALKLIEKQAKSKQCKAYFSDNCSAGGGDLATAISDATVYWLNDNTERFGLSETRTKATDARTVAYNTYAYRIGKFEIAATLLHEMFHTCILGSIPNEERVAEVGVEGCAFYSPWILESGPGSLSVGDTVKLRGFQLGMSQDADHFVKIGGVKVASYDKWAFDNASSWVNVEFKVPEGALGGAEAEKSVDLQSFNHGVPSNTHKLKLGP